METKGIFSGNGGESRVDKAPRDAATVILLCDRTDGTYEVFLMRRHRNQAFMGGAFVFPGGHLDAADADPGLAACIGGLSPADARRLLQEPDIPETTALGLFMAAIRETFEEAGILLARDAAGRPVDLAEPETAARFADYRLELHGGRLSLAEMARRENLRYAPDLLVPYSHWITPEIEARRFDTRFFLARFPERQVAVHDRMELTESLWMTPAAALAEHGAGRIVLMPPTLKTIEELLAFSSTEGLFTAARSRRIHPILPEVFRTADSFGIRLPSDSEYSRVARKQQACPGETTRIVMKDGIWKAFAV
ncbi:MAG: NUDIX hydrolase [Proteobacteria bacterium]|nr:NUDIX hydrolase [Pseudomonadota bacterium]